MRHVLVIALALVAVAGCHREEDRDLKAADDWVTRFVSAPVHPSDMDSLRAACARVQKYTSEHAQHTQKQCAVIIAKAEQKLRAFEERRARLGDGGIEQAEALRRLLHDGDKSQCRTALEVASSAIHDPDPEHRALAKNVIRLCCTDAAPDVRDLCFGSAAPKANDGTL